MWELSVNSYAEVKTDPSHPIRRDRASAKLSHKYPRGLKLRILFGITVIINISVKSIYKNILII